MNAFDLELRAQLDHLRGQGLHRELRRVNSPQGPHLVVDGQPLLNFSSNDYLGLANHFLLKEAVARAAVEFGAGSGAARLICGSLSPHHELEEVLADFKGTEAALAFSSGYTTALGAVGALLEKEDVILIDELVHACLVDAARLCGAKLRVFGHNDLDGLAKMLKWADTRRAARDVLAGSAQKRPRVLVVTESIFSMDGDPALLREIVELKERHGAWLMLDEAHATGLYGQHRRGLAEAYGLAEHIDVQMGTLGKALGAAGGYVCGSRPLIDLLIHRARSFLFSTAPVPAAVAAATAAVRLVQSAEGEVRRTRLWQRVDEVKNSVIQKGWSLPAAQSAILPLIVGGEEQAMTLASALRERGVFIPAIRYPTVARGAARLRLTVTAAHAPEDVRKLAEALAPVKSPG